MANPEHVAILKRGVEVWNQWREEHTDIQPDFRDVDLQKAQLQGAQLQGANFIKANLIEASLYGADLTGTNLNQAKIYAADLTDSNLNNTLLNTSNFTGSNLTRANLRNADLDETDFGDANLTDADLRNARLLATYFGRTNLTGVNFTDATMSYVTFGDVDLRSTIGLETTTHMAPSTVGIDTIVRSEGHIPEAFLRKAGVPQSIIEQIPALIGSLSPIDFYSCFISYSSKDQTFAERLYADLQANGVRCWYAPHDLKIGDRFADRIEESIRTYDKLLIVLSENSVRSTWVEDECRAALEKEKRFKEEQQLDKTVLFPIKLDEAIEDAMSQWVCKIRRERHIGDFTRWKNHEDYQQAFSRLLRDLKAGA